tara:strand:+ start:5933 stop:6430 length:498 start_codon:yes stop_codon:yes gene_type:complete
MALTKLTKHIVHGATIVQVRFKDLGDFSFNNTSVNDAGNITITPQYADSILEIHYTASVATPTNNDSANTDLFLDVNGTDEYTLDGVNDPGNFTYSFNSHGREDGSSVNAFHRHLPGTTNLQTVTVQYQKNSTNGGTTQVREQFICVKEIASGLTTGTPGNAYVN